MDGNDQQSEPIPIGKVYLCPGETQPISKSVHLARLSSGYDACSNCEHRFDTATLPGEVTKKVHGSDKQSQQSQHVSRFSGFLDRGVGIRGLYLNEMTRPVISKFVEHAVELLTQSRDSELTVDDEFADNSPSLLSDSALHVLVAYDWRPSSADLAVGVVPVLKRSGCEIIDLGQTSRACFDFAISQFKSDLGIFVTGGNGVDGVNGLDILGGDGREWAHPGELTTLLTRLNSPASRSSRYAGNYQAFSLVDRYEQHVRQLFDHCKPLRVALACGDPLTMQILGTILFEIGCEIDFLDLNFSSSDFPLQAEAFRCEVRDAHVDVGFLIRPDSQTVHVLDSRGRAISPASLKDILTRNDEAITLGKDGRFWFTGSTPQCDAMNVIAHLLKSDPNSWVSPLKR
ncbi:phosphohexomutase domain-containing protein [Thalassoglobus polymorphus]|uniref:Phosphomannomutase/phosphoglucomutase n=1 Tax=Thalassoglobus polymorphus TaxID=2527994 RepID=A0A517QNV0_9PLAN|nr:hypothetical protein [Thalassoglobus polymorphus]QDT33328.1 Phosphomannomutase/phosphoglucomutase [Thalassoglobus polymorphus]